MQKLLRERCQMPGTGMRATIDRYERQNERYRRSLINSALDKLGYVGEAPVRRFVLESYRPEILEEEHCFKPEKVQAWISDRYSNAVHLDLDEGDNDGS